MLYIAIFSRWYNGKHRFRHYSGISIIHDCLLSILAYFIDSLAKVDRIYFGNIDGLIFVPAQNVLTDGIVICKIAKTTSKMFQLIFVEVAVFTEIR